MNLTLKNLKNQISDKIVQRGYAYFTDGLVDDLEETKSGNWQAFVEGSDIYHIKISLKNDAIENYSCDCPYDGGPVCKHIVAVLYAIQGEINDGVEIIKSENKKDNKSNNKEHSGKELFLEILNKIKEEDLKNFIKEYSSHNKEFKNMLLARFSTLSNKDGKEKYFQLVRNAIKSGKGRDGFIDYYTVSKVFNPIYELLNQAKKMVAELNYTDAFAIAQSVVEEVVPAMSEMDDSNGEAGGAVDEAFEIIHNIAQLDVAPQFKDTMFDYCLSECKKIKYSDFGYDDNFLNLLVELATDTEKETKCLKLLDELLRINYSEWDTIKLIELKVSLLKNRNKTEQAQTLVLENIHIKQFRATIVNDAIERKEYETAKKLILEGIEIETRKGHLGSAISWNEKLLEIAQTTRDIGAVRELSKLLFKEKHYDFKYYKILKSTYSAEEWKIIIEQFIKEIQERKQYGWGYSSAATIAQIFIQEAYWKRLLTLVQLNSFLEFIEHYDNYLMERYPSEMLAVYTQAVRTYAEKNIGRDKYIVVARVLKKMQKMENGKELVKNIISSFKTQYKMRRAMMEELDKIIA